MDIKAGIKNYNIIDTNHYIVPEIEMPLRVDVYVREKVYYLEFKIGEDSAKGKSIIEDSVVNNGVVFSLINWELGKQITMNAPTPFLQLDDKDIYIFVRIEKDRSRYFCIDISFLERK